MLNYDRDFGTPFIAREPTYYEMGERMLFSKGNSTVDRLFYLKGRVNALCPGIIRGRSTISTHPTLS